jgi:phosphatidate cytidylyltransferase
VASNDALLPALGALAVLGTAGGGAGFAAAGSCCLAVLLLAHLLRAGSRGGGAARHPATGVTALAMVSLALDLTGLVYVGGGFGFMSLQRGRPTLRAMGQTLNMCLCVWNADNGALFAGRAFGRSPLLASVSPGKTVEGALGGLALATATAVALPRLLPVAWFPPLPSAAAAAGSAAAAAPHRVGHISLGLLIGVAAVCGDLVASFMKRAAGVKDSGTFFPGHGGCLDRMDSFLLASPIVYFLTSN